MPKSIAEIIKENSNAHLSLFSDQGFTVKEVQICGCCNGEGSIVEREDKGHSVGIIENEIECNNCKGSGRIEVYVTIVRKPYKPKANDRVHANIL